jgi:TonB-linked SusC/RagA family outer membrane protein
MRSLRLGILFAVALLASAATANAQVITGRITDAQSGQAVSAAQIFVAALDLGGLSEGNGSYRLQNVPAGVHTVSVLRLGYRAIEQSVTVGAGQTVQLNFALETEALALDAIVVTGTAGGSQRRAVGNVVASVDIANLALRAPVATIEESLAGRTPGVVLLPSTGAGGGSRIRIRGNSSIGLAGDPIIFVDGVRLNANRTQQNRHFNQSRLADFDPADIESIEVIKGPAAATLYGTEAADGVIQIVTKRGQLGAPVFEIGIETGQNWFPDWGSYRRNSWAPNPDLCPSVPCANQSELVKINLAEEEENLGFDPVFQSGLVQRYNVSVRGGTELIRYSFGVNRSDQEGVVSWNSDIRNSLRASIGVTANENLNIQFNGNYFQGTYHPPESFWGSNFGWGGKPKTFVSGFDPLLPNGGDHGWRDGGPSRYSPERYNNQNDSKRSTWSIQANLENFGWLSHRATFGIDQVYERQERSITKEPTNFYQGTNSLNGLREVDQLDAPVYTVDLAGTAAFRVMDDVVGSSTSYGFQYYNKLERTSTVTGRNFAVAALGTVGAASVTVADETFLENTTMGFYVQQQMDWDNRIFLTGAIRFDENSAFGTDFGSAKYPKVSGAWVLSEEEFWNIDFVDQFRFRGAWGAAGKQPDAFASSRLFSPTTGPGSQPILIPDQFGNSALGPERGEELELGFETSIFEGRASIDFTYYNRKTTDAIVGQTLPSSVWPGAAGQFSGGIQLVNIGQVSTWGTETALNMQVIQEGPVRLDMDIAFTTSGNRIDDMGGIDRIQVGRTRAHYEGFSIASISDKRVIHAEFVNGVNGALQNVLCDPGSGKRDLEFSDLGSEGLYGATAQSIGVDCANAPRLVWGDSDPQKLLNLNTTFTILDNWRLSTNIDAQWGHWMGSDYMTARHTSHKSSQLIYLEDEAIQLAYAKQVTRNGTGFHEAGFAKLREVALAYSVPEDLAAKMGASSASIRLGVRNFARIWIQQKRVGRELIGDVEMSRDDQEGFGGEAGGGWPTPSQWTARVTLAF